MNEFTTNFLLGLIEGLPTPPMSLLDRYFPAVVEETSEEVHFDKTVRNRLMAPFVSPVAEGQIMTERGHETETFKPAYLKPKTPLDPTRAVKRYPGEQMGGSLSPQDRQRLRVAQTVLDHQAYILRRLEWMASQILQTSAVTVQGAKYPTQVVDFGRDASLTVSLTGGVDTWDEAASTPVEDLHDWNELAMKQPDGGPILDFIMDPDAGGAFRRHADVKERLETRRAGGSEITFEPMREEGIRLLGTIDGFNIWIYQAWYETTIGSPQPFFPSGTVVGANPAIMEGVQLYGAILDDQALRAMRFFPKSWLENDPSRRYIMTQSAPLVVPGRPNSTVKASVLP